MNNLDDASKTLRRLRQGGESALADVFLEHRDEIRRLIANRLDPRLRARVDASDVVQEVFVRASKTLLSYLNSPQIHPIIWLRLIGKRLVAETQRQQFRKMRSPEREKGLWESETSYRLVEQLADPTPLSHAERAENANLVQQLLEDMPQMDREILEMRHVDGISVREAAAMLDITYEAAKKRYQRALQRFRKVFPLSS